MRIVTTCARVAVAVGLITFSSALNAQEPEKKEPAGPKPETVEITPAHGEYQVGDKVQFSEVAKDATGKVMDVKPDIWFAFPPDLAGADEKGVVVFHEPGEVTVGAVVGGKPGLAHVRVVRPPVTSIEIAAPEKPLLVGGSIVLAATPRMKNGNPRSDVTLKWDATPPTVARVNADGMVTALAAGTATIQASSGAVTGQTQIKVVADTVSRITMEPAVASAKTGDVVHFAAAAQNAQGKSIRDILVDWQVRGPGARIYADGSFVAELPGTYEIRATIGRHSGVASISVAPRNAEREIEIVAHIPTKDDKGEPIQSAEEWIIGNHLYYSTISDRLYVFDISDPSKPKLLDSMKADARLINDLSTTPEEKIGVFTREGASNRKNGIVFFDPTDPAHLRVISEYTETVTGGVHSAFINTHYVYLTDDATGSLRVIDFQDPSHPKEVARWETQNLYAEILNTPFGSLASGRYLHDLYVIDGLAYLAYWRDGLVILDVGNGIKGGSPEHPQLVSQYKYNHYELYGDGWLAGTHSAFRYKNYVFIGDEVLPGFFEINSKGRIVARGIGQVIDVSDIEHPRSVAWYEVPEGGVHNFWAYDDMLFIGAYQGAGRVLDISGELRGDLYAEGREIARLWTGDPGGFRPNLPFTWGAQPWNGYIYFNDINSGIWIAKLGKPKFKGSTTIAPLQNTAGPPKM
jgi:plastocyanin